MVVSAHIAHNIGEVGDHLHFVAEERINEQGLFIKQTELSCEQLATLSKEAQATLMLELDGLKAEAQVYIDLARAGVVAVPRLVVMNNDTVLGHIKDDMRTTMFAALGLTVVEGTTWAAKGETTVNNEFKVASAGLQAAIVLLKARNAGYAHLDIKPANLMTDKDNRVTVVDFGSAHKYDKDHKIVMGVNEPVYGTPGYIAPERMFSRVFDERADLYSLAMSMIDVITNYEATKHCYAEDGPTVATYEKVINAMQKAVQAGMCGKNLASFLLANVYPEPEGRSANWEAFIGGLREARVDRSADAFAGFSRFPNSAAISGNISGSSVRQHPYSGNTALPKTERLN